MCADQCSKDFGSCTGDELGGLASCAEMLSLPDCNPFVDCAPELDSTCRYDVEDCASLCSQLGLAQMLCPSQPPFDSNKCEMSCQEAFHSCDAESQDDFTNMGDLNVCLGQWGTACQAGGLNPCIDLNFNCLIDADVEQWGH